VSGGRAPPARQLRRGPSSCLSLVAVLQCCSRVARPRRAAGALHDAEDLGASSGGAGAQGGGTAWGAAEAHTAASSPRAPAHAAQPTVGLSARAGPRSPSALSTKRAPSIAEGGTSGHRALARRVEKRHSPDRGGSKGSTKCARRCAVCPPRPPPGHAGEKRAQGAGLRSGRCFDPPRARGSQRNGAASIATGATSGPIRAPLRCSGGRARLRQGPVGETRAAPSCAAGGGPKQRRDLGRGASSVWSHSRATALLCRARPPPGRAGETRARANAHEQAGTHRILSTKSRLLFFFSRSVENRRLGVERFGGDSATHSPPPPPRERGRRPCVRWRAVQRGASLLSPWFASTAGGLARDAPSTGRASPALPRWRGGRAVRERCVRRAVGGDGRRTADGAPRG
jgi:hypothetical protein